MNTIVRICVLLAILVPVMSCATGPAATEAKDPRLVRFESLKAGNFGAADPFGIGAACARPAGTPPQIADLCWVVDQGGPGWPKEWDAIQVTFQNDSGSWGNTINTGALCLGDSYDLAPNGGTATATFYHKNEICIPNQGDQELRVIVTNIQQAYGPEFQAGAKCVMPAGDGTTRHCWTAKPGKDGWPPSAKAVTVTYSNPGPVDISLTSSAACGFVPHTVPAHGILKLTYHHTNVVCLNPADGGGPTELDIVDIIAQ